MGVYKVFDGINWVDICDCNVHVKTLANWQVIDPNNCPVKYWDGTAWCEIDCNVPGIQCNGDLAASGFAGAYYVPFTIPAGVLGIKVTASPYGNPDSFSIVTSDKVTKLASIGFAGSVSGGWPTTTSLTRTSYLYNGTAFLPTGSEVITVYGEGSGDPPGGTPMSNTSGLSMYNPGFPLNPPSLPIPNLCSPDPGAEPSCYAMTYIKSNPAVSEDILIQSISGTNPGTGWKIFKLECLIDPAPCECPESYFLDPTTNLCTRVTQEPATPSAGTVYELFKPANNGDYGDFGVRLYNDISGRPYPINAWRNAAIPDTGFGTRYKACESAGLGADIGIQATCSSATLGPASRQNVSGLWAKLPGSNPAPGNSYTGAWPGGQWFSVEYCIEIDEERQFIFALAGDNQIRAKINSTTFNGGGLTNIVNIWCSLSANGSSPSTSVTETFRYWHAFPITLPAGIHRLILDGYNIASAFGFGAEIYSVDETFMANDIMTGAADIEDFLLFSTRQLVTVPPLLVGGPGQTITWTCPDVTTTFSDCYGAPSCIITETTDCI